MEAASPRPDPWYPAVELVAPREGPTTTEVVLVRIHTYFHACNKVSVKIGVLLLKSLTKTHCQNGMPQMIKICFRIIIFAI